MRSLIVLACLSVATLVHADEVTDEMIYRNSFLSHCEGRYCTDEDTGERYKLAASEAPRYGTVVNFSQPYTTEQIQRAMPYILKQYQPAQ